MVELIYEICNRIGCGSSSLDVRTWLKSGNKSQSQQQNIKSKRNITKDIGFVIPLP